MKPTKSPPDLTGNLHPDPERGQSAPPPGPPGGTPVQPVASDAFAALVASIARRLDELGEPAWARALEDATAPGHSDHAETNDRIRQVLNEVSDACRDRLTGDVCDDVARCLATMERVLEPAR
jgi:hypothetical protein